MRSLPFFLLLSASVAAAQLSPTFYSHTCPHAAAIVTSTITTLSTSSNVVSPSTLRLFVHDCFVQGCDASILIASTHGNAAERDAPDSATLPSNAFDAIATAKQAVEAACPGVVSCADVLALAARDAVVFLGGPSWDVPLGRRDGLISKASLVAGHLPGSNFDLPQLAAIFAGVGLSPEDLVVLSGAHTVGFSHCDQFSSRLWSFNSSLRTDPSLSPAFARALEAKCPQGGGAADAFQALDAVSPFKFDNQYYVDLQAGEGVLFSDQVLFQDQSTRAMVGSLASSQDLFFRNFAGAMTKMSLIGVKTGSDGEIRRICSAINPAAAANSPPLNSPPPPSSQTPDNPPNSPAINPAPFISPPNNPPNPPAPNPNHTSPLPPPSQTPDNPPNSPAINPAPFISPPNNPPNPPTPNPNHTPPLPPPSQTPDNPPNSPAINPAPFVSPPNNPPNPPASNPDHTPPPPSSQTPDNPPPPAFRFPRFPFHFPKVPGIPGFPKFPRFPRIPGNGGGGPGSSS